MTDQTAAFDHQTHGTYASADAVLTDGKLSASEKKTILTEWHASLQHILRNDPDVPKVKATSEELKQAIDSL